MALVLALALLLVAPLALPPAEVSAEAQVANALLDANADGVVSVVDVASIVMRWTTAVERGSACQAEDVSGYDMNGDGCLTVADIQAASASVGMVSAAAAPRAAQALALAELGSAAETLTVSTIEDGSDSAPGDGICATSGALCTLRAALEEANAQSGSNTIAFNIAGPGPHVISVATALPVISDESGGTTIDGYTQPGAQRNTAAWVSNAVIKIQIDGPRTTGNRTIVDGLLIASPNNVVRGLSLQRFRRAIWISGAHADDNVIAGNFIGPSATGQPWYEAIDQVEHLGGDPGAFGIWLSYSAKRNRIGGVVPADRNIISGNANDGIGMRNEGTEDNLIIGNIIGLGPTGETRLRNYGDGIDLNYGAAHNRIGGHNPRERNVISGNLGEGIEISHDSNTAFNEVINNHIGVAVDGKTGSSTIHRNAGFAISIEDGPSNNLIGPYNVLSNNAKGGLEIYGHGNVDNHVFENWIGLGRNGSALPNNGWGIRVRYHATDQVIGPGNRIANNAGAAVVIIGGDVDRITVTQNRMFSNAGLGIDIEPDGVNPNDVLSHNGANQRLDFPLLDSAGTTHVEGRACNGCTVEIFAADGPIGSFGEGKLFLGTGIANAGGVFSVAISPVTIGRSITATATDPDGNTSEFSQNVAATATPRSTGPYAVPGIVEAEDYRDGGTSSAYYDSTPGNAGGQYRTDDVDLFTCQDSASSSDCIAVGRVVKAEWLSFAVESASSQNMVFGFRVANAYDGRRFRMELDGIVVGGRIAVPNTGSPGNWTTVVSEPVFVAAGAHVLKVYFERPSIWLNFIEVTPAP